MSGSQRDTGREAAIVALFRSGLRATEIARQFGLTRERVRQILVRAGSETRHARTPESYARFCEHCGVKFYAINWSRQRFCSIACANREKPGRPLDPNAKCHRVCLVCGQPFTIRGSGYREGGGKYCSRRCYGLAQRGTSKQRKTPSREGEAA